MNTRLDRYLVGLGPLDALLGLGDEVGHHVGDELLLIGVDGAVAVDLLHTLLAEGDRGGEEGGVGDGGLDKCALGHTLLPRQASHDGVGKLGAGIGHRKGGRTAAGLGLDNLVTAKHDAVGEGVALGIGKGRLGLHLGE